MNRICDDLRIRFVKLYTELLQNCSNIIIEIGKRHTARLLVSYIAEQIFKVFKGPNGLSRLAHSNKSLIGKIAQNIKGQAVIGKSVSIKIVNMDKSLFVKLSPFLRQG